MKSLREQAMDLLSRREHSYVELHRKLMRKGYSADEVSAVLDQLNSENLQSDERFTESYIRSRIRTGYGPVKIKLELKQRGITECVVDQYLPTGSLFWQDKLAEVWNKKFHGEMPYDQKTFSRQTRFLMQRGFCFEDIKQLLNYE